MCVCVCVCVCVYTHIDTLFDFIAVFLDIYLEMLRNALCYIRMPVTAFSFIRKPVFILKQQLPYTLKVDFRTYLKIACSSSYFTAIQHQFSKISKYNRIGQCNTPSIFKDWK